MRHINIRAGSVKSADMEAATGIIIEGIKQFGGEIIGGILFAVALWMFPGLRKFFGRDKARNEDDTEAETRRQLEILQEEERQLAYLKEALKRHDEALKLTETQTVEESRRKSEIQRQLEEQRKEEERVKAEIQRKQEELRKAEEKRAEEARRKVELARQLEEKRREEERVKAEIQRRQGELRQAEARKAEEARQREEAQRQLEAMKKPSNVPSSDNMGDLWVIAIVFLIFMLVVIIGKSQSSKQRTVYVPLEPTDAQAQFELAVKYDKANNYTEAVKWYRKAAEQGNAHAQCKLGVMYQFGYGVKQDYAEAVRLYRLSAEQGNFVAQLRLGNMYKNGYGVSRNLEEADKWYKKSLESLMN